MVAEKRMKIKIEVGTKHFNYYEDKVNVCDDVKGLIDKYDCMQKSKEDGENAAEGIHVVKGQTKAFPIVNITDYASKTATVSLNGSFQLHKRIFDPSSDWMNSSAFHKEVLSSLLLTHPLMHYN